MIDSVDNSPGHIEQHNKEDITQATAYTTDSNIMLSTTVALATKSSKLPRSPIQRPKSYSDTLIRNGPCIQVDGPGTNNGLDSELSDKFEVTMREIKSDTYPRRRRSASMAEVKEHAYARLQQELKKAQMELKLKDEEVEKLSHVRDQMGEELEDLTASLFEEANNMVQDANIKRMHSEKLLNEANDKIEVLQAEVVALKALVLTSTPSAPNRHLHPQIDRSHSLKKTKGSESPKLFKGHKRSTSHHDIMNEVKVIDHVPTIPDISKPKEVDPVYYDEFMTWKQKCKLSKTDNPFLDRTHQEDVVPCLNFPNLQLSKQVLDLVENNSLTVEPMPTNHGNGSFPRQCALTKTLQACPYRIKIGDGQDWHFISQTARDRIISVCEFYAYIKYIHQGLVKCQDEEMYWHVMNLKKKMALSRLGVS